MLITCFSWPDCCHTEHVDPSGQRVGVDEVRNPANRPVQQKTASYPCPACADPEAHHDMIGIRPQITQQAPMTESTPEAMAEQSVQQLDPTVHAFEPRTLYPDDTYHGPFHTPDNHALTTQNVTPITSMPPSMLSYNEYVNAFNGFNNLQYQNDYLQTPYYAPRMEMVQYPNPITTMVPYDRSVAEANRAFAAVKDDHKPGKPCPQGSPTCHWHYARWCHESPATCRSALQAITAAFHAHGPWKDAPSGWNAAHEACVRVTDPVLCEFHAHIKRSVMGSSYD